MDNKSFSKSFDEFNNLHDKQEHLIQALYVCAESIKNEQSLIEELDKLKADYEEKKVELDKAHAKIERARELYYEAKADADNANNCAKKSIYKKLQIVRDRIYDIGETAQVAAKAKGKPIVELNNILAALEIIVEELQNLELWEESDVIPPLDRIVPKSKKKVEKEKTLEEKPDTSKDEIIKNAETIQEQMMLEC